MKSFPNKIFRELGVIAIPDLGVIITPDLGVISTSLYLNMLFIWIKLSDYNYSSDDEVHFHILPPEFALEGGGVGFKLGGSGLQRVGPRVKLGQLRVSFQN